MGVGGGAKASRCAHRNNLLICIVQVLMDAYLKSSQFFAAHKNLRTLRPCLPSLLSCSAVSFHESDIVV
jgi:hypothetical protein